MTAGETRRLRKFFGLDGVDECRFYLPTFSGPAELQTRSSRSSRNEKSSSLGSLQYPGRTFADRDARAAFYLTAILSRAIEVENIRWEAAGARTSGQPGTIFVFGSRSNQAADWVMGASALGKFLHFEFGDKWSIRAGEREFSLKAPDELTREEYERETDYGVVGRFRDLETSAQIFLIAGLGSRATEGCGYFLTREWECLAHRFKGRDFAVVLKFPPPIDPKHSVEVAAFDNTPE